MHDLRLFEQFRVLFTESEKALLQTYDFGASFRRDSLNATREFAYQWQGAEFEFDDAKVQVRFRLIRDAAIEFIGRIGQGTWPTAHAGWSTAIRANEDIDLGLSRETYNRIDDFNKRAAALADDIDEFIRFTRKRLIE